MEVDFQESFVVQQEQDVDPSQGPDWKDQPTQRPESFNQAQHHLVHHSHSEPDQGQDLMTEVGESGVCSVPALVVTRPKESGLTGAASVGSPVSPEDPSGLQRPADLDLVTDPSSSRDGDMTCLDLMSLRSDSLSLASEPTVSRRSEDDDNKSVTTSSVTSLFHRQQLDPLEKMWLRNSALGNMEAQRQLLEQDPGLVLKKDFITTALHWAAKQGRQEAVDMMLRSGADVNAKSGYTALHLASIHGHRHIVQLLVNAHHAKTGLRDYHGKMAFQYWTGCNDVFNKSDFLSGGMLSQRLWTRHYNLPSLLRSRSRSQGQLNLEFGPRPRSSNDGLDLQL